MMAEGWEWALALALEVSTQFPSATTRDLYGFDNREGICHSYPSNLP